MTLFLGFFHGLAFLFSTWLTARLCSPGSFFYLVDHPNVRSLHAAPTPRTGGLAILASFFLGVLAWVAFSSLTVPGPVLWMLGMTLVIGGVSFWDDRGGVPRLLRFGIHALAASAMVFGAGLKIPEITLPIWGSVSLGWLSVPVTVLFLVWLANLYNFMDGMDGFAGGMAVLGFGFIAVIAWIHGHGTVGVIASFLVAAAGGFLVHNMPPARIFMGDVGSVSLGFLAGSISLLGINEGLWDVWVPLLIFSPFIVDATVTLLKRLSNRKRIWEAHREHYYQRLVLAGWGHRKTVLVEYCLMIACGMSTVLYLNSSEDRRLTILLAWTILYWLLGLGVGLLEKGRGNPLECRQ